MGRIINALSWLVTVQPLATLAVLFVVTIFFAAGILQLAPQSTDETFFPQDSKITKALEDLESLFSNSASVTQVTLIFRGEALTPEGLTQMEQVLERVVTDPEVANYLATKSAVVSPSRLLVGPLE